MAHHVTADGGYSTDVRLRALLAVVGAPDPLVVSTTYRYPAVPDGGSSCGTSSREVSSRSWEFTSACCAVSERRSGRGGP